MKSVFATALFFVLSTFGTTALAADVEIVNSEADANLIIYRDKSDLMSRSVYYRFRVNGQYVGKLRLGDSLYLRTSGGNHIITANDPQRTTIDVTMGNETRYIEATIDRKRRLTLEDSENSQWQASIH